MEKILGPLGVKAMENRRLNPETAVRLNLYTGRNDGGEVVPDPNGNIIVFPFIENDAIVGEKYRAAGKKFWQKPGGKRTFFNCDALDDPSLYNGSMPLVVTEGEIDAMTAIDCGFPLSVSVPDGAPPAADPSKPLDPIDPATESSGKYEYLWNNRDRLKKIKKFIIAVDNDPPGKRLADELVRRLSASRCYFVTYPEGCKDLNDVLMRDGVDAAAAVLAGAQPYPIKGVYSLSDYPDKPAIETYATGWPTVDELFKPFAPAFVVVTGLPGSGKSSWLSNLLVNLAELHGWKAAIFSPEMPVVPQLRDKFRRIVGRRAIDRMRKDEITRADGWIGAHFVFIDHDTANIDDEDLTLEWLLERATDALLRYGIRVLVLDPWNEIEHAKDSRESMTDYVNRALRSLKKFGMRHGLLIFVVAHPTKDVGKDGKPRVPTLYDIADSSAWFNKPDFGIVIDRPDPKVDRTHVYVRKVRFEGTGDRGECVMQFNRATSRYELLDSGNYGELR